jgi:hypothetical protein
MSCLQAARHLYSLDLARGGHMRFSSSPEGQ